MTDDEIYQKISEIGNFILFLDDGQGDMKWYIYKLGPNNVIIENTILNMKTIDVRKIVMGTSIPYAIIRKGASKTYYGIIYYEGRIVDYIETFNPKAYIYEIYNKFNFLFLTETQKAERAIKRSKIWEKVKDKIIVIFMDSENSTSPDFEFLINDPEIAICDISDNIDNTCIEEHKTFCLIAINKKEKKVTIFKYIRTEKICGNKSINDNYAVIPSCLYKDDGIGSIQKTYKLIEQKNIKNFLKEGS